MKHPAIVLADGYLRLPNGKVAHGLVRGSDRFDVLGVVDRTCAGQDAGEALDGKHRDVPIFESIAAAIAKPSIRPTHAVVGIATHGGRFTDEVRAWILESIAAGLNVVNGLHDAASADSEIAAAAQAAGVELIDIRKSKPRAELHFWSGAITTVKAPVIAVLGTDCALGKRTTARLLMASLNANGTSAEMIYTGQTGWMQSAGYGFIFDSVVNDFVCGELEHAIVSCDRDIAPEVILIEGQSSLRNPSGPCGAEFLTSGGARGVVLQHAPGRVFYEGYETLGYRIPPVSDEIELISHYGARTLAITINAEGLNSKDAAAHQSSLQRELGIPVVNPVTEDVAALLPIIREFIASETSQTLADE